MEDRIDAILRQFEYLEARMGEGLSPDEYTQVSRDYAALEPTAAAARAHRALLSEIAEAEVLLEDAEMAAMAREELERLTPLREAAEAALRRSLIPRDAADAKSAILEIRPGTGGDEAALFAGDLFRMYQRYADARGWKVDVLSLSESDLGGLRELVAGVRGAGVFARFKFESGTHRVQRVPETESGGRIHTSAATVAVLPEAEDIDITINESDLRIETMRASGAGGQHVNTTDSAVRLTHVPSGIVVTASEKSQHQNRARAMEVLRARLYDQTRREADEARAADRKAQVGSGDRSERIRTYNFPQGRVTDHRIGLTLYKLDQVLAGDLDEIVDALTEADQAARLAEIGA